MIDNSEIVDLESEQASLGKFVQFYSLQQNQIERSNVSLWLDPILFWNYINFNESLIEFARAYLSIRDIRSSLYKEQKKKNLV